MYSAGRETSASDTRKVLIWGAVSGGLAAAAGLFIHSWGLFFVLPALGASFWTLRLWARVPKPREMRANLAAALATLILVIGIGGTLFGAVIGSVVQRARTPTTAVAPPVRELARRLGCQNVREIEPKIRAGEEAECELHGDIVGLGVFRSAEARDSWVLLSQVMYASGPVIGPNWAAVTNSDAIAQEIADELGGERIMSSGFGTTPEAEE